MTKQYRCKIHDLKFESFSEIMRHLFLKHPWWYDYYVTFPEEPEKLVIG